MWESSEVKHGRAEGKVNWLMFASYFLDFHTLDPFGVCIFF